jgi:hypothetical protein
MRNDKQNCNTELRHDTEELTNTPKTPNRSQNLMCCTIGRERMHSQQLKHTTCNARLQQISSNKKLKFRQTSKNLRNIKMGLSITGFQHAKY